jgi:hypothetical protein
MLSSSFRCDQIHNNSCRELGHTVVLLMSDLYIQQTSHTGQCDQIHCHELGHTFVLLMSDLDIQQTSLQRQFT